MAIIAVVAIAASYAYFAVSTTHSNSIGTISATMDCMNVTFTNSGTGRLTGLTYQYPVTDGYAVSHVDPVVINVTNNCTTATDGTYYTLALTTLNNRVSILGDANLDGSVTVDDANLMMGWLARGTTPSTINNFYNADINNDKTIDIDDINYVIGLLNSPVGLIGDVDEDGDVDNDDYSLLADYLAGHPGATIGTQGMLNADVNGNGTANAPDRLF